MPQTLAEFLSQDLDTLIERNVDLAAMYKATLIHAVDRSIEVRKPIVDFSYIKCDEDGNCCVTITYKRGA